MNAEPDPLLDRLKALPAADADPAHAERVRRRAHTLLASRGVGTWAALLWSRFGVPAVLAGVVGVYLTWAVRFTAALYR